MNPDISVNKIKPDFIIIGGMKCATSTLHDQFSQLDGVSMSSPKEPCYFSDDLVFEKGASWYADCFDKGGKGICGESSTHYSKLPTYPKTVPRMVDFGLSKTKFIYVVRHPIQRMVSQYIHEWTQNEIRVDINEAITVRPDLVNYSRFSYQLEPYIENFSPTQIKVVFFESLISSPELVFRDLCDFIGIEASASWNHDTPASNVSKDRIRNFPLKGLLVDSTAMTFLRRALVPETFREFIKQRFQMKSRPVLSQHSISYVSEVFNRDLCQLGESIGVELSLANYEDVARRYPCVTPLY